MTAEPRVQRPNGVQLEFRPVDLHGLLSRDQRARIVWDFIEGLDLRPLYAGVKAGEGHAGRPPIDPAILMGLWLYATLEGVGSAVLLWFALAHNLMRAVALRRVAEQPA